MSNQAKQDVKYEDDDLELYGGQFRLPSLFTSSYRSLLARPTHSRTYSILTALIIP